MTLPRSSFASCAIVVCAALSISACKQEASPAAPSVVATASSAPETPVPPAVVPPGSKDPQRLASRIQASIDKKAYVLEDHQLKEKGAAEKIVSILYVEELRLRVSATCLKNGKLECAAIEGLKSIVNKPVKVGGGNPSAYYCAPAGGKGVTLTRPAGESQFCRFSSDDSMIDDWALVYVPETVFGP